MGYLPAWGKQNQLLTKRDERKGTNKSLGYNIKKILIIIIIKTVGRVPSLMDLLIPGRPATQNAGPRSPDIFLYIGRFIPSTGHVQGSSLGGSKRSLADWL